MKYTDWFTCREIFILENKIFADLRKASNYAMARGQNKIFSFYNDTVHRKKKTKHE